MKKYVLMTSCCLWMSLANAQLSCTDLAALTVSLEELSEVLEVVEDYGVNSELDTSLSELIVSLKDVAIVEQDVKLTRWVEDLKMAWNDMERDMFESSLKKVTGRLDEMGLRDCNG